MPTEEDHHKLSRALSGVDQNHGPINVEAKAKSGLSYSIDERSRLERQSERNGEQVDVSEACSSQAEGIVTPPNFSCPNPPPPTPASPEGALTPADGAAQATIAKTDCTVSAVEGEEEVKKKKKKKSSGKNKKPAATGFEEFYADPPITLDEYAEESDIYHSSRPFSDRIQTCIQRYRARRSLDALRANIFTKYLMLGGVEATTKAFNGGLDQETLENCTAAEIAAINAMDYVRTGTPNPDSKYYDGSENWVVDFEGVTKGFFSYRIPRMFPIGSEKDVQLYCLVIRNFLNYVLQHGVCPEYTENVIAARNICDLAENELCAIKKLGRCLPGDFNVAASALYGGRYQGAYAAAQAWGGLDMNVDVYDPVIYGLADNEAERIFKTAVAFSGTDDLFLETMRADVHIVKSERKFFEVVHVERPDIQTIEEYASVKNSKGETGYIKALGIIKFKARDGPGLEEEDYTDDEDSGDDEQPGKSLIESFWLEDEILQLCFVGLKLELMVHELNIGIKFFDTALGVHCSFHTVLPNEKMVLWKAPVLATRSAPTEENPDVEETVMDEIMEREFNEDEKAFSKK